MSTLAGGTIDDNVANDLFDNVTAAEAAAGSIEYRGFYIKNAHATLTLTDARIYISSDSTSATDELDIAIASEAIDVTMGTIANETTAPSGPTFSHPTTYSAGLAINSTTGIAAGSKRGVWIRRTVTAGSNPIAANSCTLRVEGYTT